MLSRVLLKSSKGYRTQIAGCNRITKSRHDERFGRQEDSNVVDKIEIYKEQNEIDPTVNFYNAIEMYKSQDKFKRGLVEFLYDLTSKMKECRVNKNIAAYKALLSVFPEKIMVPENSFQVEFFHYPKQQKCAGFILNEMSKNDIQPDEELYELLQARFGEWTHVLRKYKRERYWRSKLKHACPFVEIKHPLDQLLPPSQYGQSDNLEMLSNTLAKLALYRMFEHVDMDVEFYTVYQFVPASIAAALSNTQQTHHSDDNTFYKNNNLNYIDEQAFNPDILPSEKLQNYIALAVTTPDCISEIDLLTGLKRKLLTPKIGTKSPLNQLEISSKDDQSIMTQDHAIINLSLNSDNISDNKTNNMVLVTEFSNNNYTPAYSIDALLIDGDSDQTNRGNFKPQDLPDNFNDPNYYNNNSTLSKSYIIKKDTAKQLKTEFKELREIDLETTDIYAQRTNLYRHLTVGKNPFAHLFPPNPTSSPPTADSSPTSLVEHNNWSKSFNTPNWSFMTAQSPEQREMLKALVERSTKAGSLNSSNSHENVILQVEGPTVMWVQDKPIKYFTLKANFSTSEREARDVYDSVCRDDYDDMSNWQVYYENPKVSLHPYPLNASNHESMPDAAKIFATVVFRADLPNQLLERYFNQIFYPPDGVVKLPDSNSLSKGSLGGEASVFTGTNVGANSRSIVSRWQELKDILAVDPAEDTPIGINMYAPTAQDEVRVRQLCASYDKVTRDDIIQWLKCLERYCGIKNLSQLPLSINIKPDETNLNAFVANPNFLKHVKSGYEKPLNFEEIQYPVYK